ncbi:alkaline phosphatase D family protein [Vallicoccus soli]|uniref:alkaline phosphatase D family protein n=1 Tax=Vallicoccus soli TaxID=2339232 RepID=UPI001C49BC26|nr:alkaline phosphatase D family protein [Vallicoccus soli]
MTDAPALLLGPALRHVDDRTATVWVEASRAGTVGVDAGGAHAEAATFCVEGHHYALVVLHGLEPDREQPYAVTLDGERAWPLPGDDRRPPTIRTLGESGEPGTHDLDVAFGSCRADRPQEEPWTLEPEEHPDGVGPDALVALSRDCQAGRRRVPDLLLLLGDQVYADEGLSPRVRERQVRRRGAHSDPRQEVADFEEYTWLYRDSWGDPDVRWLLATVPSAMVFDDHDVRDDWNTSDVWRDEVQRLPWWEERITGAYMSYWVYQHLGNLSPAAIEEEGLLRRICEAGAQSGDGGAVLREFARTADEEVDGEKRSRWSYRRHLGRNRLVVIDTRSGRVLEDDRRDMLSEGEWRQVEEWLTGDVEHLVVASSLPLALEPALHDVEAWNERLCAGAWGRTAARLGERFRQAVDLEHWAAFERSFRRLTGRLGEVAEGRHGAAPATVLVLSGDVHHSYVAPITYAGGAERAPVLQVVSSPLRNAVPRTVRRGFAAASSGPLRAVGRALRRSVGLPPPPVSWRLTTGPLFGNGIGSLRLSGRTALVRLERALPAGRGPGLRVVHEERLGEGTRAPSPSPVP